MQHPSLLPLPRQSGAERRRAPTPCDADGHTDRALGKRMLFLNDRSCPRYILAVYIILSLAQLHLESVAARTVFAAVAGAVPKRTRLF